MDKLINQQDGILAYKVINDTYLLGDILTDRHDLQYIITIFETMKISEFHCTQRHMHSQLFIRYRAIKTFNSLPGDLRSASSPSSFRNKLKLMLYQRYRYQLNNM